MTKTYIICLSCGTVLLRTDVLEKIETNYIYLDKKRMCPRCNRLTKFVATKDISKLKKDLVKENKADYKIMKLIGA